MFALIADILTSITSILFPIFASYKALNTSDPAVLTPWLMYWTTLSLFLLVESWLHFILYWVPFYPWIRLGIHLYLVLPGKQGCVYIYKEYLHPFLEDHERQIDRLISEGHEKAKAAGMDVVKRGVEYVRVQILGQQPSSPVPPQSRNVSYSTYLFNRFAMPSAREGLVPGAAAGDLFNLLGAALQQYTPAGASSNIPTSQAARDLTSSGTLIPPSLHGAEREDFVNTQRERLRSLLQAFDAEAFSSNPLSTDRSSSHRTSTTSASASGSQHRSSMPRQPSSRKSYLSTPPYEPGPASAPPGYAMHPSRSESEFEDLGYETMPDPEQYRVYDFDEGKKTPKPAVGSKDGSPPGWSNWIWGASYGERDSAKDL